MIKFELRKIKYFDAGSEETPCFTAEIWEKGKKVAYVKNEGRGGGNYVDHVEGLKWQDVTKFDNLDVEAEIFGRVWEDFDIKRLQTKGLVLKKGDSIKGHVKYPMGITKWKKHPQFKTWTEKTVAKFEKKGYQIMNRNL